MLCSLIWTAISKNGHNGRYYRYSTLFHTVVRQLHAGFNELQLRNLTVGSKMDRYDGWSYLA